MKKKKIEGTSGHYSITDDGRVWSERRRIWMRLKTNRCGYKHIRMSVDRSLTYSTVHRLVAKAFLPNPRNLPEINHLDGNKNNNSSSNLEWCSRHENMAHAHSTGIIVALRGVRHGMAKLNEDDVRFIRAQFRKWFVKPQVLGRRFGVTGQMIKLIVQRKNWKHI